MRTAIDKWPVTGWREAGLMMSAISLLLVLTHSGFDTSEAQYHYAVAQQIVSKGELGFDEYRAGVFTVAPNGRTYASHEIGNTLFLLPIAAINQSIHSLLESRVGSSTTDQISQFLVALHGAFLVAAGTTMLYLILRTTFSFPIKRAVGGALIALLCSYYWSYSRYLFDGVLCSVALMSGTFFLFLYGRSNSHRSLVSAAFACFGIGLITRLSMVIPILGAFVYLIDVERSNHRRILGTCALAGITLIPFAGWQLFYNHLRTGSWLLSPVQTSQYAESNGLTGGMLDGIVGLLFSPGKSVLVFVPVVMLSIICFPRFWRQYRHEALFIAVVGTLWLMLHAKLQSWYGAWGYGPRHFVTLAPLMAIPYLVARQHVKVRAFRSLAIALLSFGFLLSMASIVINWHYRMTLASQEHRLTDDLFVWGLKTNQAVDTLVGAQQNIYRFANGGSVEAVPNYSAINVAASNSINIWLHTAYIRGVPSSFLWAIGIALVLATWVAFRRLLQISELPRARRLKQVSPSDAST